ncbi:MAG: TonB-dependent receptor domain-containing protein [Myxococcaceae bacterium]
MTLSRTAPRALLLLALLLPLGALADARVEARRHFKAGMAMINGGDFEAGISELLEAYAIKPHPSVLYNVAKAYLNGGRVPEALEYYRRYLATGPPDAAQVAVTVEQLEASRPKRPKEPERPPERAPINEAPSISVDEETLRKLAVLTARMEQVVERAEKAALEAETPARAAAAEAALPALPAPDEGGEGVPYEETVVTASRRAQSTLEAPNATTVITAEELRLSGATTLPELLRRVPGAEVMTLGVDSANVSFRGFNQRIANKVLVLLDGRPEYQDFLGITLWPALPVGLEEIERIEVIRGPGSALYGANAMLGVVNIITRSPGTGPRAELTVRGGSGNQAGGSFVASGGEKGLKYRASAGYAQENKWSRDFAEGRPDVGSMTFDPNLGLRSARGNLTTHYAFSREVSISAAGGVNRLFTEIYPLGLLRNFYLDGSGAYVKADLNAGPMKMKVFWNHLDATAGPQYSAIGQRSLATSLQSNVFDGEALFGKELELGGTHRFDVGVSGRLKRVSWDYLAGLKSEVHAAAFVQDEWRIIDPLRIVASYRIDRHPLLQAGSPGYAQSPRASVLWMPAEGHALRASWATAFREPTFLESYTDIRVPLPGVNGGSALTRGDTSLKPERLVAWEVGYRGELPRLGLDWDVALYQNEVSQLVNLSAPQPLPAGQSFDEPSQSYLLGLSKFYNEAASYTARGAELGAKISPIDRLDLKLSAAFQKVSSSDASVCGPCTQAPALKVYAGLSYRSRVNLDLAIDGAYTSSTTWIEREPSAADPTQIAAVRNPLPDYAVFNARVGYRLLSDTVTVAVVGTQLGHAHAEHPFGNLVERRVLATLTVMP